MTLLFILLHSNNVENTFAAAEHPDMVQEFLSKTQNSRSVMLEWKPPRKTGVFHYKVHTCIHYIRSH